jgi:hypothetical protein
LRRCRCSGCCPSRSISAPGSRPSRRRSPRRRGAASGSWRR